MQVPHETLRRVLELYNPNCRYLVEADVDYPSANGKFILGPTAYAQDMKHMTAIEAQLCLNQLCYAAFGVWLPQGMLGPAVKFPDYAALMKENMFIIDSRIRFEKPIPKDAEFVHGGVKVEKAKNRRDLHLARLSFEFERE
ncbi:MAG: FcoT family thioesterase, partial [Candidatus Aenigmatarchaeota archaeon]